MISKAVLIHIENQFVLKIITTDNARRFNQYYTVFDFEKRHFLECMSTSKSPQYFNFSHSVCDTHKISNSHQISESCQILDPREILDPRQILDPLQIWT